jgi:NAD(P)-dependent dehydrogenase (short-subunit alcohol dehydrogenase family)
MAKRIATTKTVVMTGGTSGLGAVAAARLRQEPRTQLILGARGVANSALPLDLASLASVRAFAQAVTDQLGSTRIDILVLNAGTQFFGIDQRTRDGFETTFAVNHLAHYLLLRLLLPKLADGATVVITTSNTHDPKHMPLAPKSLNPEALAHSTSGGRFGSGFRAYASSKLCNLLTARALAASAGAKSLGLNVIAYNPGLTLGTSLFRAWPFWARSLMNVVGWIRPIARLGTVERAGKTLADLATGQLKAPVGRLYASLTGRGLTWPDPSDLAMRDDVKDMLWQASARMVSLNE